MPEEMVVRPLTGEEVQEAVLHKIKESMSKTCNLRPDDAYTSFRAEITIRLTLSDYGREVSDNHHVVAQGVTDAVPPYVGDTTEHEEHITMDPMPPNQVRIESDQRVPVEVTEDGKKVTKHVRYAPRKTPKVGPTI